MHPDVDAARKAVSGGLAVFAHFSGFGGMKTEAMEPTLQKAARALQTGYDLAEHGKAGATHAKALDPEFIDRFGIVGPLDVALPRFERLAKLGLDFCRVIPGSRDAAPEVVSSSMMQLASAVRPAVAAGDPRR